MPSRSRALLLAGGTVALVTVTHTAATRRRRTHTKRSSRPSVHLVPAIAATAFLGQVVPTGLRPDWAFFSGFVSWIPGLFNWAINAITDAVEWSAKFVLDALKVVWDLGKQVTDNLLHNVGVLTTNVAALAEGAIELGYRVTVGLAEQGRDLLAQMGNLLEHVATQAFDLLKAYVDNLLALVLEPSAEIIERILKTILGPAWDMLQALIELGADGFSILLQFALDPIGFIWGLISPLVTASIDAAFGGLGELLEILMKLIDVLKWLADHIDDLSPAKLDDIFSIGLGSFSDRVARAFDDNSGTIESKIAGWLG